MFDNIDQVARECIDIDVALSRDVRKAEPVDLARVPVRTVRLQDERIGNHLDLLLKRVQSLRAGHFGRFVAPFLLEWGPPPSF